MLKTVLHIGYSKTGTTWFQRQLFNKIPGYRFVGHNDLPEQMFSRNRNFNNIKPDIDKLCSEPSVISDENLLGTFASDTLEENAKFYSELFPDSIVLLFIRNQTDKLCSVYSEYIKMGGTLRLNDYLWLADSPMSAEEHYYNKTIDIYYRYFGKNRVVVVLFEDFSRNQRGFVTSLLSRLDLPVVNNIKYEVKENISLSVTNLNMLRCANVLVKKYRWLRYIRTAMLIIFRYGLRHGCFRNKKSSEEFLGRENYLRIKEMYKDSNMQVARLTGIDNLREYNY